MQTFNVTILRFCPKKKCIDVLEQYKMYKHEKTDLNYLLNDKQFPSNFLFDLLKITSRSETAIRTDYKYESVCVILIVCFVDILKTVTLHDEINVYNPNINHLNIPEYGQKRGS